MAKVFVGMSGGVDSSVSAHLLQEEGHDVVGLFMKNWEEEGPDGVCRSTADFEDAQKVAGLLEIPLYSVNFVKEYWDRVFSQFLTELKAGFTPNPDILCNREIKFQAFFEKAMGLGADFLATGHYCQTKEGSLLKGSDPEKDQSYFLYTLKREILEKVLFPVGHLPKAEVRAIAKKRGLPTHDKKDSTGICFIGKRNFKEFVHSYLAYQTGPFQKLDGSVVGKHDGAAFYTIGQRKGLGIGGPGDAYFVVGKDMEKNIVFVEQGENHPALFAKGLTATEPTAVGDNFPRFPFRCRAKIRYRQKEQPCLVETRDDGTLCVTFDEPQRAITPRQSVVFYEGESCLGGALIGKPLTTQLS